ncbi:hypothetical protein [Lentzea albida]|uniref:Uncharacterized protein n=1 Tax=Lentzea albida TaxID=65499 RepID=A0A1H9EUD0_9PSEU|nr:hypothetical protein [Lentzea albida]SEQ28598.1 hypothetical protein SAMN04488000_102407 [Lentzea albida]
MRGSERVLLALLVTAAMSGCTTPEPGAPGAATTATSATSAVNTIVLDVTGTATITSLTLVVDGATTEEKAVTLPWSKTLEFPVDSGRHEWKLQLKYGGGDVLAKSTANGKPLTQTAGSGSPGSDSSSELSGSIAK